TSLRQFADLGLTEEQRTKIRSLISAAKQNGTSATDLENQIENVLTDAQKTQLASEASTAVQQGAQGGPPPGPPPDLFKGITLTSDQQAKIKAIFENARSQGLSHNQVNAQIESVLTDSQKTTFEQNLQNAQASDPGRFGGGSSSGSTTTTDTTDAAQQALAALSIVLNQLRHEATGGSSAG
ncbi:MAG TPA: hypothetical protein VGN14_17135, partial [Candidatus Elarobacter sp.]